MRIIHHGQDDLYFVAPKNFLQDKRTAYGHTLSVALSHSEPISLNPVGPAQALYVSKSNDIIIEGPDGIAISASLPVFPGSAVTNYTVSGSLCCT